SGDAHAASPDNRQGHFTKRLAQVEDIIRRNQLVTLPDRTVQIRLATAAESAQMPSASLRAPRLIGNTGEQGVFIFHWPIRPTTVKRRRSMISRSMQRHGP